MATLSVNVIEALRKTAKNLENGAKYQWGHMGSCNCGNLAQVITNKNKAQIHQMAMRSHGDWNEQLTDYCMQSGLPLDYLIDEILAFGFSRSDLAHLEKLSDPQILKHLPADKKHLKHNAKDDVILYLKTWANLLENQLIKNITLEKFNLSSAKVLV